MRCAAMRFSSDRSGVRRTSGAPACAEPPAATRLAVSARACARVGAAASRATSNRPAAAGSSNAATRSSDIWPSAPMSAPANVTDNASRLSRLPSHIGHRPPIM